ncbi:putative K domain, splicing factor 1, helix-hairpin domain, K domain, type 1 superfamily [Helianthus anomalus]
MSSKVQPVSMEDNIQAGVTTTASVSSTASPKVSLFAKKSGFVIPKNKLSGSLVPAFRRNKKPGGTDVESEDSTKQILRKTKWGPDLTQDAFVKKGRASAYQTRLDQITQQLKSGILEVGDDVDQDSPTAQESSDRQSIVKSELEAERREVIGEILKLNPSFKAPPDYKPLLKEDKVVIPIKENPGHNFIGLIFGPAGDTQKRLEKETGAKIRVYGTKAGTKKESEITSSDGNEVNGDYEKLYVHVTAETYEKVDAAVSLIELLVTPVLANVVPVSTNDPVSGDNLTAVSLNQDTPVVVNTGSGLEPPLARFQPYPNQWAPPGQSPRFIAPPFPTPPNSGPMSSSFSPRPVVSGQNMVHMHNTGYPGPPRNPSLPPLPISAPTGPNPNVRPMGSASSRTVPPYTFPEQRPLTSSGWSQPPARTQMQPMARPQPSQPIPPPPPVGFRTRPPNPGPTSWFPSPTTPTSIPPPSIQSPPITPSVRPQQPSSNDFTFQTNRAQSPSFRPGMSNHVAPPVMQGFHRPQNSNQMGQHQGPGLGQQSVFPGHGPRPPPNHLGPGPGPRQFALGPPPIPFQPRPGNFGSAQQIQPGFRPQNLQPIRGNVPYTMGRPGLNASGPQQVYDPFSPTAVPHKHGNPQSSRKQDSDPEYDDLMASVGVK